MHIRAPAIIVAVRAHGEHGAVVRAVTAEHGLLAGYVRGGRSRHLRPVLIPGNIVDAEFRARSEAQLAALTVELSHSRAALLAEPLAAAGIAWVTALAAVALPEGHPYPRIHAALDGALQAIELAPSARGWAPAIAGYEDTLLSALGYGEDNVRRTTRDRLTDILSGRRADILDARVRLFDLLDRAMGR